VYSLNFIILNLIFYQNSKEIAINPMRIVVVI